MSNRGRVAVTARYGPLPRTRGRRRQALLPNAFLNRLARVRRVRAPLVPRKALAGKDLGGLARLPADLDIQPTGLAALLLRLLPKRPFGLTDRLPFKVPAHWDPSRTPYGRRARPLARPTLKMEVRAILH